MVYTTTGTVTKVIVTFQSGAMDRTTWSMPVGSTEQFAVTAYDSAGRVITGRAVTFKSSNASVLSINATTGLATGIAAGSISYVSATIDGVTGKTGGFSVKDVAVTAPTTAPITRVAVAYVAGAMDTATWTLPVGGAEQFAASAYDSTGAKATTTAAVYRSTNAAVLTVDSATGVATAVATGSATVSATIAGVTGASRTITVGAPTTAPASAPASAPAATASSVAINVVRFGGTSGAATVSSGLPLAPGMLRPGAESMVRITVGGVEQPAYVTGLPSLHPDGSLRAVLVQFRLASLGTTPVSGRVDFSSLRPATMTLSAPIVTPGTVISGTPTGLPQAAALPSSPTYLVSTDLVGPTTTAAANAALGGVYARYESDFTYFADRLWASEGYNWVGDYYDRVLIYYAMWARTGNPTYWARAGQMAYDYRTKYLEPNAYGSSPHSAQLEGLEKHYLLTGDAKSRVAVAQTANRLYTGFAATAYMTRTSGESRIAARVLHAQLLGWRLSTPASPAAGLSISTWENRVEYSLNKIFVWQQADGSFPADGQVCGGQLNYMVGMQNDALIKTYDYYTPTVTSRATLQTKIRNVVIKAVNHMWSTQWVATSRAFKYASVNCTGIGGTGPAPDLNNMIAAGFGWAYKVTGNAAYLTEGDLIFAGGVQQAYLSGSKQFNEEYTSSFRYLGYR